MPIEAGGKTGAERGIPHGGYYVGGAAKRASVREVGTEQMGDSDRGAMCRNSAVLFYV